MLKYLIPIYGLFCIWKDIPHYDHERSYKPLQGDHVFTMMILSGISTLLFISILICLT